MSRDLGAAGASPPGDERARPRYHYTPEAGWINDPVAGLLHRGRWHLFVQTNPDEPRWGLMRWGHLIGDDLTQWTDAGLALEPTPGSPDEDGCWSGSVTTVDGGPVFFYTAARGAGGHHRQAVIRARPVDDSLDRLVPELHAPLVGGHDRHGTDHQRDPFVLRWDERWLMLLGTGLRGDAPGGAVVAWTSDDGDSWRWQGVVHTRPAGDADLESAEVWECPQLVRIDDTWVLIVSVQSRGPAGVRCDRTVWFTGAFDGDRFTPSRMGLLDGGDVFYAPSVMHGNRDGRCLIVGWLQESPAVRAAGPTRYSGALSIVREVRVRDGVVGVHPVDELDRRFAPLPVQPHVVLGQGERRRLHTGPAFRLRLTVWPGDEWAGVVMSDDGDRRRTTVAVVGGARPRLVVGDSVGGVLAEHAVSALPDAGPVELDVFRDGSIVEAFAAGAAISVRVESPSGGSDAVCLAAGGATASRRVEFDDVRLSTWWP
jgi:beta-fructofuranosidase